MTPDKLKNNSAGLTEVVKKIVDFYDEQYIQNLKNIGVDTQEKLNELNEKNRANSSDIASLVKQVSKNIQS